MRPPIRGPLAAGLAALMIGAAEASQYLRLVPVSPSSWAMQTAVVRCSLRDRKSGTEFTVDLISTVHLAASEYYAALQRSCDTQYDRVCFEMIADDTCFDTDPSGTRYLVQPLEASKQQRALAAQYGLAAQTDSLDCTGRRYVHADTLRSELGHCGTTLSSGGPLLARMREAWDGIVQGSTAPAMERGFSLLLRLAACALPAPELVLLLDDWIVSGGATASPTLRPIVRAALSGDVKSARALALAQTLITGERVQTKTLAGEIVRKRNLKAVASVQVAVDAGCRSIALLFGALHMRDMRSLLEKEFDIQAAVETRWDTAWNISLAEGAAARAEMVLPLAALALLAIDAGDWLDAVRLSIDSLGAAHSDAVGTATLGTFLYFARHLAVYLTLSSFVFDWNSRWFVGNSEPNSEIEDDSRPFRAPLGTDAPLVNEAGIKLERWLEKTAERVIRALEVPLGLVDEDADQESSVRPSSSRSNQALSASFDNGRSKSSEQPGFRRGSRGFRERVQKAMARARAQDRSCTGESGL